MRCARYERRYMTRTPLLPLPRKRSNRGAGAVSVDMSQCLASQQLTSTTRRRRRIFFFTWVFHKIGQKAHTTQQLAYYCAPVKELAVKQDTHAHFHATHRQEESNSWHPPKSAAPEKHRGCRAKLAAIMVKVESV